jgi:hypothetical protein
MKLSTQSVLTRDAHIRLSIVVLASLVLCGCQSTKHNQAELARICADPANRVPGQFYFDECAAFTHLSAKQLQRDYRLGPQGD